MGPSTPGAQLWVARYSGPGTRFDGANALGVSPDGSIVFVTGESIGSMGYGDLDYATVAYDASTGSQLWVKRYAGPAGSDDYAGDLGVSPDGSRVFVTGDSYGSTGYPDYATVAYDASTGSQLWVMRYDGPGNVGDFTYDLEVSPDGSAVFVTGSSIGSTGNYDYATVAYDASTGSQLWARRTDGPGTNAGDSAFDLGVSPDGSAVFVTGFSLNSTGFSDFLTVAYDASTGSQLWAKSYNGPANGSDAAVALGVSPDGSAVFVTGGSVGPSGSGGDYATVAYDASTGSQLWAKSYNGPANDSDFAIGLGVSPEGSTVFVTGNSIGSTSDYDYATVAYNASTGSRLWAKRYNGPRDDIDDATALGVSPDGSSVFVTGFSTGPMGDFDYATLAYDATTGSQLWVRRYNGPVHGHDWANALGVSPDGSTVFVAGSSTSRKNLDYATVAYSIT